MKSRDPILQKPRYVIPSAEKMAADAFMTHYRAYCFQVDVEKICGDFRKRFQRPVIDHWQERRKAVLWRACLDLKRVQRSLGGGKARQLIAEKYDGTPLKGISEREPIVLRLSGVTVWRIYRKGIHRFGGSPDAITCDPLHKCGRRSKKAVSHQTTGA